MSSSGPVIVQSSPGRSEPPKNIIDAISDIQRFSVSEVTGSLPEDFFTIANRLDMFFVGLKTALAGLIFMALLTPLSLGVIGQYIPIFGAKEPTLYDQFFAYYLMFAFTLSYAFLVAMVGKYYRGTVVKVTIRNLMAGVMVGATLKALIIFIIYHVIYFKILTPQTLSSIIAHLMKLPFISTQTGHAWYYWLLDFRPVFIQGAWLQVIGACLFIAIPMLSIAGYKYHRKKEKLYDHF
ncbi:hypothetical protein Selin_1436 [Desulfurispirillum indicum S5]|uniref:Uncharacterized protein n=1 Tax=Desulfurispirillum indicum (strain ATCC BAA-1389 / DSM 22839 / S5) TaxID=653733 RepID=E6W6S7_DESIS|nr:hypothetical protein [Desulfurispirillum indicum]ADU66170.1 hypothetical protein Selin_1436 [Desulfurispirillum indicum S5]